MLSLTLSFTSSKGTDSAAVRIVVTQSSAEIDNVEFLPHKLNASLSIQTVINSYYLQSSFMNYDSTYRIFPLGDSAISIDFGNTINEDINKKVLAGFDELQSNPLPGMIEAVPAYSSLTLYYDPLVIKKILPRETSVYEWIKEQLEKRDPGSWSVIDKKENLVRIPVCYENEFAPDLNGLAHHNNISVEEVIRIHLSRPYRVYMLGFLPGFAYMGPVDQQIRMPRKPKPAGVAAGSVGIAGSQTGIYPLPSPGGWQIIGRTPVSLFDPLKTTACLLKAGDTVQFYSISSDEYTNY